MLQNFVYFLLYTYNKTYIYYNAIFSADVRFIALGDWGEFLLPGQTEVALAMDVWAADHQPEFVVTTGDNFYPWGKQTNKAINDFFN